MCSMSMDHTITESVRPDVRNCQSGSGDDFTDDKSEPSSFDTEAALFLADQFFACKDSVDKAPVLVHRT